MIRDAHIPRNPNMRKRHQPRAATKSIAEAGPISLGGLMLLIICAAVIAAGFFFAARQHFMSMELGIKNSKLRKQVEDLESEQRRLLLAREVVRSPGEIKRLARNIGFRDKEVVAVNAQAPQAKAVTVKAAKEIGSSAGNGMVRTVSAKTVLPEPTIKKPEVKPIKTAPAKEKKEKADNFVALLR